MSIIPSAHLSKKLFKKNIERIPMRDGYGRGVVEAGKRDKNVVVLCADLTESTRSLWFAETFPERFIEVGVAEQNMAGLAAGMALSAGKIPFIASYAVFSPGRNWDQLRVSVCYSGANVKIMGAHAGISVGPDGATHQALEDIAITRVLPRMTVMAPCDWRETQKCVEAAARMPGSVYIRFGREKVPTITTDKTPFTIGKANVYREGSDVTIIACGQLVYEALIAAEKLSQEHIETEVIDMHTIKPLDTATVLRSMKKTGCVVTAEEHQVTGGLGSAVAEALMQRYPVPQEMVGMPDCFGESGQPQELLEKYGMTADDITAAVRKVLKRKKYA